MFINYCNDIYDQKLLAHETSILDKNLLATKKS